MTTAVRFKGTFCFRGWEGSNELIAEIARQEGCKPSHVVRQLVRAGLQARGIDPVQRTSRPTQTRILGLPCPS